MLNHVQITEEDFPMKAIKWCTTNKRWEAIQISSQQEYQDLEGNLRMPLTSLDGSFIVWKDFPQCSC